MRTNVCLALVLMLVSCVSIASNVAPPATSAATQEEVFTFTQHEPVLLIAQATDTRSCSEKRDDWDDPKWHAKIECSTASGFKRCGTVRCQPGQAASCQCKGDGSPDCRCTQ